MQKLGQNITFFFNLPVSRFFIHFSYLFLVMKTCEFLSLCIVVVVEERLPGIFLPLLCYPAFEGVQTNISCRLDLVKYFFNIPKAIIVIIETQAFYSIFFSFAALHCSLKFLRMIYHNLNLSLTNMSTVYTIFIIVINLPKVKEEASVFEETNIIFFVNSVNRCIIGTPN